MRNFICESCFDKFDSEENLKVKNHLHYCYDCYYSSLKTKAMKNFKIFENPF